MSTVEFVNVSKKFDDGTLALDSLNLKVEEGEFLVLLGPSGCGKSTALRMLAGLEDTSDGDILIGGTRVNDLPPGARELGMVFQSYALYPHMTVKANLSFGLERSRNSRHIDPAEIEERVASAADLLGLAELFEKHPRELSGGQQQRVAIGRALVRRPKVLLMDEPLSNLDAKLRNRMRIEIRKLHEQHGTTTIYVTHDQIEAMTLADRIAVMNTGRLQQHAAPLEAYDQPANAFVASFLGTPPMNLVEGSVSNGQFEAGELQFTLPDHLRGRTSGRYFGIRPENIHLGTDTSGSGTAATIVSIESLGSEAIVHLNASGQNIIVSDRDAETANLGTGSTVSVSFNHPSAILLEE